MVVAILLSALLAFLLGWLWYSDKMFGPAWHEAIERPREDLDEGIAQLAVQMVGWIAAAFVYGFLISHGFINGIKDYLFLSIALWGAFFMPPKAMAIFNGNFSTKLIWIDGSYILASYIIFAFVFALFV